MLPMPALSPTMVTGNIAQWALNEGDKLEPGAVICEVETDKATVDYEAQDDGYLAKILVPAGTSDVDVGTPIGIVVEDADLVAAFKDYAASPVASDESPKEAQIETPKEEPVVSAPSSPELAPQPKAEAVETKVAPPAKAPVVAPGKGLCG